MSFRLFSQTVCDTVHLQTIDICASPSEFKRTTFQAGKKNQNLDTGLIKVLNVQSIGDLLNYQSAVFIKNYTPGSISSASARGGSAQQTVVMWNGININHPMLGQLDFSQINSSVADNIQIEYGASSSLWGSGAVNGIIHLNNSFKQQNSANVVYRYGSFNTHQSSGKFYFNALKLKSYLNAYWNQSDNDYKINDTLKLKNASFLTRGINGGLLYQLSHNQHLQIHSWYHIGERNIPNNYFMSKYASHQLDESFRNVANYLLQNEKWKLEIKGAYLFDRINYTDSTSKIFSNSKVHTFQTEEIFYKNINTSTQFVLGHQWIFNYAITSNYNGDKQLIRNSIFSGFSSQLKKLKWNVLLRKEWANIQSNIPITGNIGAEWITHSYITLKAQASYFYRLPTLNDLYWRNSGDVHLKPESGYQYEGGFVAKFPIKDIRSEFGIEWTMFNKITNNWIIWLPGGNGQPIPANIAQVWSRGTETDNYWLIHLNSGKIKWSVHTAYILSTIEKSTIPNDASIGKQLIYTPRYNINSTLQYVMRHFSAFYQFQYVGYRFVTSDNLQWLDPYSVSNLMLSYTFDFKRLQLSLSTGVNNLFNKRYMIIAQRPMPGRNYFIQLQWQLKSKN
ncbi:MAG: TonB-dependent receptor [Bacteroidia bacterium]|nr:MAG: TonB-dependent receptor [Bacteroidia bacterium]